MFDWGRASSALLEVGESLLVIAAIVAILEGVLYLILDLME